jgi:hypothetical protein
MASGSEGLREAVRKHRGDVLLTAAAVATAESKWKAVGSAIKDVALYKLIGPTAVVLASFKGIEGVVKNILRDTGSLKSLFEKLSTIKGLEAQFKGLLGSVEAAKRRVAELIRFTNGQKLFDLGSAGRAARELEILTKGAYAGGEALETVGDAAAASRNELEAVARVTGEFHRALAEGRPVRAVAQEMEAMGVISGTAAERLSAMQEEGAGMAQTFATLTSELAKSTGSLDEHAKSADGVAAAYANARKALGEKFAAPFQKAELQSMQDATTVLTSLQGPVQSLGEWLNKLVSPFENLGTKFTAWLAKLGILPQILGAGVMAIKALVNGLLVLGIALGAFAIGRTIGFMLQMAGVARKGSASLAAFSASARAATASVRALFTGNTALATSQAAVAGRSLKAAVALGAMAAAGRALGLVIRALLIGTGIMLVITVLGALAEKLLGASDAARELADAQREQSEAHRQVNDALAEQIANIQNLDDAQQALTATNRELTSAYADLAKLQDTLNAEGKKKDSYWGWLSSMTGESADAKKARGLMPGAQQHIAELEGTKLRLQRDAQLGRHGVSAAEDRELQRQSERDLQLEATARRNAIERATGGERLRLLEEEAQREEAKAAAGDRSLQERAMLDASAQGIIAQRGGRSAAVDEMIARLFRSANSPIIREEQDIEDVRRRGGGEQQGRVRGVKLARIDLEENQAEHARNAASLRQEIDMERKAHEMHRADLAAEKEIARLKDQGFEREETEQKARIDALIDQQGILRGAGDEQGAEEIGTRVAAAERELRIFQRRAQLERAMNAARLAVIAAEEDAATLAEKGDFAGADRARREAIEKADAAERRRSLEEKVASGQFKEGQAEAAVAAEQAGRDRERAARAEQFRAAQARDLERGALALGGRGEDLTKFLDEDAFRDAMKEGLSANLGAREAAGFAFARVSQSIQQQTAEAQRSGVVDSLQRIAGGGGIGADPVLTVAQRQQALQERMVALLSQIEQKVGSGEAGIVVDE